MDFRKYIHRGKYVNRKTIPRFERSSWVGGKRVAVGGTDHLEGRKRLAISPNLIGESLSSLARITDSFRSLMFCNTSSTLGLGEVLEDEICGSVIEL